MNNINTENRKNTMQIVYCIMCTLFLFYVTMLPSVMMLDTFAAFGLFCVCHSVLLARKNFILCIIPCAVSVVAIAVSAGITGGFTSLDFIRFALVAFALAVSALLNGCSEKKTSGGVTFVLLTVAMTSLIIVFLLTLIYEIYGSINVEIIRGSITSFAKFFGDIMREAYSSGIIIEDANLASQYTSTVAQYVNSMEFMLKTAWPSMISTTGMLMAAFVFVLYKPTVKLAKMEDKCLEARVWKFGFSRISAVFFEIVIFAYLILSFFSNNAVLNIACMNLISVLMLPFAYIGFRHVTGILKRKFNSKIAAVIVVCISSFVLFVLLQGSVLILASLIGSSAIFRESIKSNGK